MARQGERHGWLRIIKKSRHKPGFFIKQQKGSGAKNRFDNIEKQDG